MASRVEAFACESPGLLGWSRIGAQVVRARGQAQVQATAQALVQAQATGADHPYVKYGGNVAPIPDHTQPDSFWRQVYDRSGLVAIQKLSASLSDWAKQKANEAYVSNLSDAAHGSGGNPMEAYSKRALHCPGPC